MEEDETDVAALLGIKVLEFLGFQNEEDCQDLGKGLEMLRSEQMQEHCSYAARELRTIHQTLSNAEARKIIKTWQFVALITRIKRIRHRKGILVDFNGSRMQASSAALRIDVRDEDDEAEDDIAYYVKTIMQLAMDRKSGEIEEGKRRKVPKMSAPS